jgi:hypothetical protein
MMASKINFSNTQWSFCDGERGWVSGTEHGMVVIDLIMPVCHDG